MRAGGELLQEAVPDTLVFKAFNTAGTGILGHADGSTIFADPSSAPPQLVPLTMMYAGPTEQQDVVEGVIRGVGFRPEYVGPIRYARNLEVGGEQCGPCWWQGAGVAGGRGCCIVSPQCVYVTWWMSLFAAGCCLGTLASMACSQAVYIA